MIGQISGGKRSAQRGEIKPKRARRSAPQARGSPQAAAKTRRISTPAAAARSEA
jgi:hypothetical protein